MKKFLEGIKNHVDFNIYPITWILILIIVLTFPVVKYLPLRYGYENGLLENIQMVFLFAGCILGFMARTNKQFFRFISLVVIILMLREINCGRTLFFPVPGTENTFYSWKEIKYGWLAHPLYGLYMGCVGIYFLWNKLYINLWHIFKNIKLPIWNILLMLIGAGVGMYAEKALENMLLEEMMEMLFYASLMSIIWLYGFNKKFFIKKDI